jgi:hypothetical protein
MAYHVSLIPDTSFALAEVAGKFTTDELHGLFTALLEARGQLRGVKIFCDVSAADSTGVSTDVMLPVVDFIGDRSELFAGMKWAVFAPSLLNFAIGRMAGEMAMDLPFEYEVFTSREKALNWLAMPLALRKQYLAEGVAL